MSKKAKTIVLDNGGETFDRYTIVLADGETYGASHNPFHPQGFGQYTGNVCELFHGAVKARELCWSNRAKAFKKVCIKIARTAWLKGFIQQGNTVITDHSTLPEDVQKYIAQLEKE